MLSTGKNRKYYVLGALPMGEACATDLDPTDSGRVGSLWFADGNVVLIAEDLKFRVHRSIVSKSCPVFGDLFMLPQPMAAGTEPCSEVDDGVAVVNLPDKGRHLFYFLSAIYNRTFFSDRSLWSRSTETIAGIITLAHKYDARCLYHEALRHLEATYATTLAQHDALSLTPISKPAAADRDNSMRTTRLSSKDLAMRICIEPVFLINVVRRIPTPELLKFLPHAFYQASLQSADSLVRGAVCIPHRILFGKLDAKTSWSCIVGGTYPGIVVQKLDDDDVHDDKMRELLHPDDLRRIIAAQRILVKLNSYATKCFHPDAENLSPECARQKDPRASPCSKGLEQLCVGALKSNVFACMDPLASKDALIDKARKLRLLCDPCQAHLKRRHTEARQKVWDDLKNHFDLESWP